VALVDLERHVDALPDIRTALEAGHRPAAFLERAAEAATEAEDYDLAERCHELLLARDDLTESQRAGALASAAYFLARHRPDEVTRAQAYVAEALRLRPTRTAVRASATIVEIETALQRAAAPESVDLSPYVEMLRDGGSPSGYRRGPAHGLLERILAAPAAGPENRFAAGAMLAQSRIDSGSFDEARALVQRLESMDLPPDLQPALVELRLSLYGAGREASPLDETSLREPPEPPDEPGLA